MPRPLRIEYENAYYHVMNRGAGRRTIFHGKDYFEAFLQTLEEASQRFGIQVLCYCLMSNHYHLLVKSILYLTPLYSCKVNIILDPPLYSTIDKKIELNNRINTELEAMAKLIYDYWFVQFDFPDANGKPYKSSGGKMVYNEALKREIPEGWGNTTLGDISDLYQPQTISEKDMNSNGEHLVYGANGIVGRYDKFNHEGCVVTITCRGNSCGTINTTRPFSWITGNAMVVNPKSEVLSIDYILCSLYWASVSKVITGSAQPQITRTNLAPLKLLKPDDRIVKEYSDLMKSNHAKRINNQEENERLTALRDWLFPMLMNGQVTVNT